MMATKAGQPPRYVDGDVREQVDRTEAYFQKLVYALSHGVVDGALRKRSYDAGKNRLVLGGLPFEIMQCGAAVGGGPRSAGVIGSFNISERKAYIDTETLAGCESPLPNRYFSCTENVTLKDPEMTYATPLTFVNLTSGRNQFHDLQRLVNIKATESEDAMYGGSALNL